ncbi:hypothetical protein MUK42_33718 [Musa troglodytarum]|uniref:Uncharacterized protein n=1 Tax=Musa troglodytarum TaxID=320322 RepID=A0A9E7FT07_9LILI|nr:hypothetical protein MUK42_33718 [Musa troglodytarum]
MVRIRSNSLATAGEQVEDTIDVKGCCIPLRWGKNESSLRPIILIFWFPADPGPKVS